MIQLSELWVTVGESISAFRCDYLILSNFYHRFFNDKILLKWNIVKMKISNETDI